MLSNRISDVYIACKHKFSLFYIKIVKVNSVIVCEQDIIRLVG